MLKIDDENNIYLTRGDYAAMDVIMTHDDGSEYTLQTGDSLVFTVRRIPGKGEIVIQKMVTAPLIELDTDDTKDLTFGDYKYDVYLINSLNERIDTFIADKVFTVGEEVHDFESTGE